MFTHIPWNTYLMLILVLTLIYYAFIGYLYFRKDLVQLFNRRIRFGGKNELTNQNEIFQAFTHDIRSLIDETGNEDVNKEEFKNCVKKLINRYPKIQDVELKNPAMAFILRECVLSIHLSEQELRELWN